MNKKVVIYLRVSSREQKEGGFSIPSQRKLLINYAIKNGFKIVKEFEDKVQEILDRYKDKKILSKYNTKPFVFKGKYKLLQKQGQIF